MNFHESLLRDVKRLERERPRGINLSLWVRVVFTFARMAATGQHGTYQDVCQAWQFLDQYDLLAVQPPADWILVLAMEVNDIVTVAFWVIYHVYARPNVRDACRQDATRVFCRGGFNQLKHAPRHCRILLSAFYETIRHQRICIPHPHLCGEQVWGPTAGEFMHNRFLPNPRGPVEQFADRWVGPDNQLAEDVLPLVAFLLVTIDMDTAEGMAASMRQRALSGGLQMYPLFVDINLR